MFLSILTMILPIVVTFLFGVLAKKISLISVEGCQTLKTLVSKIMLPAVLFNAFLFADYSASSAVSIIVVFVAMLAVLGIGYLVRKAVPDRSKYFPFVFSSMECGSLGYPLIAMLYGLTGSGNMAIIDVGHTVFLFMLVVPIIQATEGEKPDALGIVKNALTSPTFDSMLFGILFGIIGVDTWLLSSPIYDTYSAVQSFLAAPTGMLILLTLGYDMSLRKDLMKPVLFTSVTRLITMWVMCAVSCLIIFNITPYDKGKLVAMILAYSLPASYAIPVFGKYEGHKDYIATTISVSTIFTLLVFVGLSAFAMM